MLPKEPANNNKLKNLKLTMVRVRAQGLGCDVFEGALTLTRQTNIL